MSDPDFVNIHDAKTHFSKLIKVVEGGGEIVIALPSAAEQQDDATEHGQRVGDLFHHGASRSSPWSPGRDRPAGGIGEATSLFGSIWLTGDLDPRLGPETARFRARLAILHAAGRDRSRVRDRHGSFTPFSHDDGRCPAARHPVDPSRGPSRGLRPVTRAHSGR